MRLAAAIREGEPNILLTGYLKTNSRMMIHRKMHDRLHELAGFLEWDNDPYLVITDAGRLVWIVDGYTTSEAHPYSRSVDVPDIGRVNYIRNAVKATVDAYDGETHMYVFAPDDPIIAAYQQLVPAAVPGGGQDAGGSAAARALSGDAVPGAGGDLPDLPHAGSAIVLQQGRPVGPGAAYHGAERRSGTGDADLRGGDAARRGEARVPADDSVYAAQQGQPDRADGGALRRRRRWARWWCCSSPSRS